MRWACVGTNMVAKKMVHHLGDRCVVVWSRSPEKLQKFMQEMKLNCRSTTDFDEVLNSADVDVVYINTPNATHEEFIIKSLQNNKHVLSEKSLCVDMSQALRISDAVAKKSDSLFFVEGLMHLSHPIMTRLQECLVKLGPIASVSAVYNADIHKFVSPGGSVFNLGCYPVSVLQLVVGKTASRRVTGFSGPHEFAAVIDFNGGDVFASILVSERSGKRHQFDIIGKNGSQISFISNPFMPEANASFKFYNAGTKQENIIVAEGSGDCFKHQIDMVSECIAQKKGPSRPSPTIQDSFEIMEILSQIHALGK